MAKKHKTNLEKIVDYYFEKIDSIMTNEDWELVRLFNWSRTKEKPILNTRNFSSTFLGKFKRLDEF